MFFFIVLKTGYHRYSVENGAGYQRYFRPGYPGYQRTKPDTNVIQLKYSCGTRGPRRTKPDTIVIQLKLHLRDAGAEADQTGYQRCSVENTVAGRGGRGGRPAHGPARPWVRLESHAAVPSSMFSTQIVSHGPYSGPAATDVGRLGGFLLSN